MISANDINSLKHLKDMMDNGAFSIKYFVLINRKPVRVKLSESLKRKNHFSVKNRIRSHRFGKYWVSTVFLNYEHMGGMFETMIFNEGDSLELTRAKTHREALKNHQDAKAQVKNLIKINKFSGIK